MKKRKILLVSVIALLLALTLVMIAHANQSHPRRMAEHVVNSAGCLGSSNAERDIEKMEAALEALKRDQSPDADAALSMLIGYYMGEHNGEELGAEVVRRGPRMLPLLELERDHRALLVTCTPTVSKSTIQSLIPDMISAIHSGKRWD